MGNRVFAGSGNGFVDAGSSDCKRADEQGVRHDRSARATASFTELQASKMQPASCKRAASHPTRIRSLVETLRFGEWSLSAVGCRHHI